MRRMVKEFPGGSYETWGTCMILLPHARAVLEYILDDKESMLDWTEILSNAAWYLYYSGDYVVAGDEPASTGGAEEVAGT